MRRLKDVVVAEPRLLLVGINPGLRSGALGHHFAGNGNPFWRLLAEARLIPAPLTCAEDQRLAESGIALTNLCPRPSRSADELGRDELLSGRNTLLRKCRAWKPDVMALVGVGLYPVIFGRGGPGGPGAKPDRVGTTAVYVVPNPSGLNASFPGFASKLIWFRGLRDFLTAAAGNGSTLAPARPPPDRSPRSRATASRRPSPVTAPDT